MKIAIVGDPRRKEKDLPLVREAEKVFDSCLYVPIDQIRVEIEKEFSVRCNGTDLTNFDYVLPVPTLAYAELFYSMLRALSEYAFLPFTPEKYLLASNESLFFSYMKKNGIKTRNFLLLTSKTPWRSVKKEIAFPSVVKTFYREVIATNPTVLRNVASLTKARSPILVYSMLKPERSIWTFLTGDFVASYEKVKGFSRALELQDKLKAKALQIKRLMGCDYCALNFLQLGDEFILNKFTLSPNFSNFERITKKNVAGALIATAAKKVKEKGGLLEKFFEVIRR